jgi:hypothetical protein
LDTVVAEKYPSSTKNQTLVIQLEVSLFIDGDTQSNFHILGL